MVYSPRGYSQCLPFNPPPYAIPFCFLGPVSLPRHHTSRCTAFFRKKTHGGLNRACPHRFDPIGPNCRWIGQQVLSGVCSYSRQHNYGCGQFAPATNRFYHRWNQSGTSPGLYRYAQSPFWRRQRGYFLTGHE